MFKIFCNNCCGLDIHTAWIYSCFSITNSNQITEYKQIPFSSFPKWLKKLAAWLVKHSCTEVCKEATGKHLYLFSVLTSSKVLFFHFGSSKYTKPQKENRTDCKYSKWICDLFICCMTNPSFISSPEIR